MAIYDYVKSFFGKPVEVFDRNSTQINPKAAIRLRLDYDDAEDGVTMLSVLENLAKLPNIAELEALIIGCWEEAYEKTPDEYIEFLVQHKDTFKNLKALFITEQTMEENEISWIQQGNFNALWSAYPNLQHLQIRGGEGLDLGEFKHQQLKKLVIQSGGLPARVVQQVAKANLPALTHLELWLGTDNYGGDAKVSDIKQLVSAFEDHHLAYLGLCNSDIQAEVVKCVLDSNIAQGLDTLDFTKGTLIDDIVPTFLQHRDKLKGVFVDVSENFLSDEACDTLAGALELCCDAQDEPEQYDDEDEVYLYVSVGE